jgi:transglutaminase/protease-like cytokinesis protein 3
MTGTGITTIEPDYTYSNGEAERRRVATADAVAQLVANSGAATAASDAESVTLLHDAIAGVARYDWDAYASIGTGTVTPAVQASQEAYGILVSGTAVCTGYAEAMLLAAHAVGIPAVVVTGEVNDGITTGGHAWNRVRVDGAWRVVDVTWDDATAADGSDALHHDYLLLPLSDPALSTRSTDAEWVVDGNDARFQ